MGYNTRFELKWSKSDALTPIKCCDHNPPKKAKYCMECGKPTTPDTIDAVIGKYIEERGESIGYALAPDGTSNEVCKWYEWQADVMAMSAAFAGVLFTLTGHGEDKDDIWVAYFRDGKSQVHKAEIVFPACAPNSWA